MKKKYDLSKQLLHLLVLAFLIIFITIGVIIPKLSSPVYERVIYYNLEKTLEIVKDDDIEKINRVKEVAYICITDGEIHTSSNIKKILGTTDIKKLVMTLDKKKGIYQKDKINYYYYHIKDGNREMFAVTNDKHIINTRKEMLNIIVPILLFTCSVISLLLFIWGHALVRKIYKLKDKVDNLDNPNYSHELTLKHNDEFKALEKAIESMRLSLLEQEKLKNEMYQNISHDFKTPLTVIKSYIEAVEDGIEDKDTAFKVILEQTNNLQDKVHSLLYLNKLDYLNEQNALNDEEISLNKIIKSSTEKFKHQRKDINIKLSVDKSVKFKGTEELWETVIDNILNNFVRYAETEIKITVKNNKITLYNDGPNIDEDFVTDMFIPFRKGIKGEFGIGLSIVKKTLNILQCDIAVKNHKNKGVSFIITKKL